MKKNWKPFQRKPSALNIEEQLLPLSASYVLPNLVNLLYSTASFQCHQDTLLTHAPAPQDLPVFFCRGATWPAAPRMATPPNVHDCHRLCHHTVLAGPFFQNAQVPLNGSPVLLAVPWLFLPTWCHMWTCWGDILPQHQGHWWRCWAEQLQHQALRYTAWHRLSAGHWYFKPEGPACFAQTVVHPCGP